MICTGISEQTALDFYLSFKGREYIGDCRGPIVYLKLNSVVANRLHAAAQEVELEGLVMAAFISLITEETALFGSCMAHWVDMAKIAESVGKGSDRIDFVEAGGLVFRKSCEVAGWDHRELDNYMHSLGTYDSDEEE